MIPELKKHILGSIKRIGYGAYCDAFKVYYDVESCPMLCSVDIVPEQKSGMGLELSVNGNKDSQEALLCEKCKVYKKSDFMVIKEIQFTDKYDKHDFALECKYHKNAYSYMPDLIVKLYDSYTYNYTINHDDILHEAKYGLQETKPVPANPALPILEGQVQYGYLLLEYMNYKDLYLNYVLGKKTDKWLHAINMKGLILICLVLIYNLHCKLNMCHGDIRDTNIFLRYIGPEYKQKLTIHIPNHDAITLSVDTGGFHIKLGDFGLADKLVSDTKSFIFRDYEILDNIYQNRNNWRWMVPDVIEYDKLIQFLRVEFIYIINERMVFNNISIENIKNRREFWFIKHQVSNHSMFLYKYPERLLIKYIEQFYPRDN